MSNNKRMEDIKKKVVTILFADYLPIIPPPGGINAIRLYCEKRADQIHSLYMEELNVYD